MNWRIVIDIEGDKPTPNQIQIAKMNAENAVIETLGSKARFTSAKALNTIKECL